MEVSSMNLGKIQKVSRIVRRHKYERLSQNNQIWWNNKFKELEANIRIPAYKKFSELKTIFTKPELKSLQAAGLVFDNDEADEKLYKKKRSMSSARRKTGFQSTVYVPPRRVSLSFKSDAFIDRLIEFYKRTPEEAKLWSVKQKRDVNQSVHLMERAAIVEETLAEDFDKWFSSIKTDSTSEINKNIILNIFEINSSLAINKAVVVKMQLMKSVPDAVAKYLGEAELASSNVVKHEINSDIKASKLKPINKAFGKMLPPKLCRVKHVADNKIKITSDHKDLETFAAVFKDIMELETSRRFVTWLQDHPEIPPPQYLKKNYMILKKKMPKKSFFLRQIYEAKVWAVDTISGSNSSEKQTRRSDSTLSESHIDDSISDINFLV